MVLPLLVADERKLFPTTIVFSITNGPGSLFFLKKEYRRNKSEEFDLRMKLKRNSQWAELLFVR